MYVYIRSESASADSYGLWTVGHYAPDGTWHPESDHDSPQAAADRVHWLNGGDIRPTITVRHDIDPGRLRIDKGD